MNSRITPDFFIRYRQLDPEIQIKVRRARRLFLDNPRHGSLRFKRIRGGGNLYSARVDDNYRVLGELNGDSVTWHWVGPHDEYERMIP